MLGIVRGVDALLRAVEETAWAVRSAANAAASAKTPSAPESSGARRAERDRAYGSSPYDREASADDAHRATDDDRATDAHRATDDDRADDAHRATDDPRVPGVVDDWFALPSRPDRLLSTGWMLAQLVGSYRWLELRSTFVTERRAERFREAAHRSNARRFARVSRAQGGAFLKVGQLLSARPDVLPASWIAELSGLQDAAEPVPFESLRPMLEADLGPLETRFRQFDVEPIAAASIGQVHRAVTHDGVKVAVKIQRPNIESLVAADLRALEVALTAFEASLPPGDYGTIIGEIRRGVLSELDYERERRALDRAGMLFRDVAGVRVATAVDGLSSTRVLTTRFERGRKITDVLDDLASDGSAESRERIADILGRMLESYLRQILLDGHFQADPHPGNFLVADDGALVLLDFGCTKELEHRTRVGFGRVLSAFVTGNDRAVAEELFALGFRTRSGTPDTLEVFARLMLGRFREALATGSFTWPTADELKAEAKDAVRALGDDPVVELPPDFVMIGRVFGLLGGLFQHYKPELDWSRILLPWISVAASV